MKKSLYTFRYSVIRLPGYPLPGFSTMPALFADWSKKTKFSSLIGSYFLTHSESLFTAKIKLTYEYDDNIKFMCKNTQWFPQYEVYTRLSSLERVNTDLLKHINSIQDRYIEQLLAAIHTKSIHNYITGTSLARGFNSVLVHHNRNVQR